MQTTEIVMCWPLVVWWLEAGSEATKAPTTNYGTVCGIWPPASGLSLDFIVPAMASLNCARGSSSSFFFSLSILVRAAFVCSLVLYIALGEHDFQFPLPTATCRSLVLWLGMLAHGRSVLRPPVASFSLSFPCSYAHLVLYVCLV